MRSVHLHEIASVLIGRISVVNDVIVPFEMPVNCDFPNSVFPFFIVIDRVIVISVATAFRNATPLRDRIFHTIAAEVLPEQDRPVGTIRGEGRQAESRQEGDGEN